jgi:hypothetical protein
MDQQDDGNARPNGNFDQFAPQRHPGYKFRQSHSHTQAEGAHGRIEIIWEADPVGSQVSVLTKKECLQMIMGLIKLRDSAVRNVITHETIRRVKLE